MPNNGAITPADLIGRGMERLTVACELCQRRGSYALAAMRPEERLPDFLDRVTAACEERKKSGALARCHARFIGL